MKKGLCSKYSAVRSMIDLRSDANTLPTSEMRAAMLQAEVGDDQYGEDPSINALEARVASLLGKERALFVPSGTMANQVALRVLTQPGDEVISGGESHVLWHETGAAAANAGVQITSLGTTGVFTAAAFRAAVKPRGHIVFPPTGLVVIENTHNRGGGLVFRMRKRSRSVSLPTSLRSPRCSMGRACSTRPRQAGWQSRSWLGRFAWPGLRFLKAWAVRPAASSPAPNTI